MTNSPRTATEPRLAADRHDAALTLAIGLVAAANRFEDLLHPTIGRNEAPLRDDDPVVMAALGAVALAGRLRRWLEEAASANVQEAEMPTPARLPHDLLR